MSRAHRVPLPTPPPPAGSPGRRRINKMTARRHGSTVSGKRGERGLGRGQGRLPVRKGGRADLKGTRELMGPEGKAFPGRGHGQCADPQAGRVGTKAARPGCPCEAQAPVRTSWEAGPQGLQPSCHSADTQAPLQALGYSRRDTKHETGLLLRSAHPRGGDRNKRLRGTVPGRGAWTER